MLLIGEEPHPPYQRPPLSKKYLLGELERERLFIRPLEWYIEPKNRGCVLTPVSTAIEALTDKQVVTRQIPVRSIEYDKLTAVYWFACARRSTRFRNRRMHWTACYTLAQHRRHRSRMAPQFQAGRKLLIIGGGYIGLEAAAVGASSSVSRLLCWKWLNVYCSVLRPRKLPHFFRELACRGMVYRPT